MATVWVVVSRTEEGELELETFSARPRTPGNGGERENWPGEYLVYEADVDGGDSILVEQMGNLRIDSGMANFFSAD